MAISPDPRTTVAPTAKMDRQEEASGDERERRATERVSSAAAVGRRMGLGLG